MPFKTFANGAILTDTDLNDYLMEQTVIACTSGSRPASPNEGMTIYETDTDSLSTYVTSWQPTTLGGWRAYTATLTASTTNPTLGTGGLAEGRYMVVGGKICHVRGTVKFGSSGANAGSGQYLIALPFTASSAIANGVSNCGSGVVRSAGLLSPVIWYIAASSTTMAGITPTGNNVTSGTPGAFTNNDYLSFSITYEI